ncbi:MAG: ribose 5-phosphate isomerase B [Acidimicrobiia bacterium]|nr:ribose 5-phosphate isomerase B [Acidimicrobiia bacterium]NNL28361.1 ribose 5-phosphate isomerase B [Acidimicrobiia bacterium]
MAPSEAEIRDVVRRVVAGYAGSSPPLTATSATPPAFTSPSRAEISTIAVGADHGGYALKERIAFRLRESGREVIDCGTDSTESVDYPDFAHAVASRVASGEAASGIIIDGAGIGSAMVANKVPGVRAALCYDISSARNSREHNHANVLTLGAGLIGSSLAQQIVETWLETPWGPGRHADRVAKINAIEHRYAATSAIGTTRT